MISTSDEARLALAAMDDAEHQIAKLADCPPWRHAAFAILLSALVAQPLVPLGWRFGMDGAIFLAAFLIYRSDRRRLGVFINGYRRGRTRLVIAPLMLIWLALYSASYYVATEYHAPLISAALAVVAFVVAYVGSVMWQRVFKSELGA